MNYDKMSLSVDTMDFSEWLTTVMNERGWSQSDLARKANINRQVISSYINRQRIKPDENILKSIASALSLPPEEVFRAAGLLPTPIGQRRVAEQIVNYRAGELTDAQLAEVLTFMEFIQTRDDDPPPVSYKKQRQAKAPPCE